MAITVLNVGRGQLTHEKRNHNRVQRATLVPPGFHLRFVVARETRITVELPEGSEVVRARFPGLLGFLAAECRALAGLRNASEPAVVVTGRTIEAVPAWLLRRIGGYVWVSDLWDLPHKELITRYASGRGATDRSRRSLLRVKNAALRFVLRRSDLVVTVASLYPEGLADYRIPASKVVGFPNAIRLDEFDSADGPRDAGSICYVTSRFLADRGLETLVAAVEQVPGIRVTLAGDLDERGRRLIAGSDAADRFDLLGAIPIEEAHALMRRSEIGVVPFSANRDLVGAYPIKLLEYMAAGAVAVASDLPGIRAIVTDGSEAVLVEPDDANALAGALRDVAADAALRDRLRTNARRRVQEFDARTKNEQIYSAILESVTAGT